MPIDPQTHMYRAALLAQHDHINIISLTISNIIDRALQGNTPACLVLIETSILCSLVCGLYG